MKKTLITAAAVAMSAGLVGVAAASSGSPSILGHSPADVSVSQARSGADDPLTHDLGDDRGSGGHGSDG